MRAWAAAAVGLLLGASGCASVRVVQRNGCWVKQTESFPKTIREEVGPCMRPEPRWTNDRVARLVQECLAAENYRWQSEALAAWSRGAPLPAQRPEETLMRACMKDAGTALLEENEALRRRVAEVSAERDGLAAVAQQEREHLRSAQDRMTDALGEAANRPAPNAFASANSTGTASTQSDQTTQPGAPLNVSTTVPMPEPVVITRPAPAKKAPACGAPGPLCNPPAK